MPLGGTIGESNSKCSEIPIIWLLRQPEFGSDGSKSHLSPLMEKLCPSSWAPTSTRICTLSWT